MLSTERHVELSRERLLKKMKAAKKQLEMYSGLIERLDHPDHEAVLKAELELHRAIKSLEERA